MQAIYSLKWVIVAAFVGAGGVILWSANMGNVGHGPDNAFRNNRNVTTAAVPTEPQRIADKVPGPIEAMSPSASKTQTHQEPATKQESPRPESNVSGPSAKESPPSAGTSESDSAPPPERLAQNPLPAKTNSDGVSAAPAATERPADTFVVPFAPIVPQLSTPENAKERAEEREQRFGKHPQWAIITARSAAYAKLVEDTRPVIDSFFKDPTAKTAADLDRQIAIMRQPENLHFIENYTPLGRTYAILMGVDQQNPESWTKRLELLDKWRELSPRSSAPLIAKSGLLSKYAWNARGSGFAFRVTEEGGRLFAERIALARSTLEAARNLDDLDVDFYYRLIDIEKSTGRDTTTIMDAVKKASKLAPEYMPTYREAALFLLPRWHGQPGDVEEFANQLFDDLGGEVGAKAFIEVIMFIHNFDNDILTQGKYDRAKIRAATEVVFASPQSPDVLLFTSQFCWALQDVNLARRFFERKKYFTKKELESWSVERTLELANQTSPNVVGDRQIFLPFAPGRMDFSPDGTMLAVATNKDGLPAIAFVSLVKNKIVGTFPPAEAPTTWCRFVDRDGTSLIYDVTDEKTTHFVMRNLARPKETVTFDNAEGANLKVNITQDGSRLAAWNVASKVLTIWDGKSGVKKQEKVLPSIINGISFTRDNKLVLDGNDDLKIYDPETDSFDDVFSHFPNRDWFVYRMDGVDSENCIRLISAKGKDEWLTKINCKTFELTKIANTNSRKLVRGRSVFDGQLIIGCDVKSGTFSISVDNLETGEEVFNQTLFRFPEAPPAIAPDRSMIAVDDSAGLIRLYNLNKPKE